MKRVTRGSDSAEQRPEAKVARKRKTASTGAAAAAAAAAVTENNQDEQICFVDRLPDHLVVRIFNLLGKEAIVFLLPQVCRRWCTLVKSEDLWKDTHLFYDPFMATPNKKLFFKCFQMAPILNAVTLELDWSDRHEFAKNLIINSPQEISALHFIYDNMPPEVMFAMLNKYKNCVEKLMISDTYTPYVDSDVKRVWSHIQNLSKLKHLIVDGAALLAYKASFKKNSACWKSLQILDVKDCSYEDMNTVQRLISFNPNWTEVYLATNQSSEFRKEVKALSKCVKLDAIQVPFCKELKLLQNCTELDTIVIDCVTETEKEVSSVISSLSKSTVLPKLKKVKIIGAKGDYVKLLKSLLQERGICLLNLVSCDIPAISYMSVLKCVPGLESLFLHEIDAQALQVIANEVISGSLPNMKKLVVDECSCVDDCVCAKLVVDQIKEHSPNILVTHDITCKCKPSEKTGLSSETTQNTKKPDKLLSKKKQQSKKIIKVKTSSKKKGALKTISKILHGNKGKKIKGCTIKPIENNSHSGPKQVQGD